APAAAGAAASGRAGSGNGAAKPASRPAAKVGAANLPAGKQTPKTTPAKAGARGPAGPAKTVASHGAPPAGDVSYDKVGRNDPCPCGSGMKYKRCHGLVA
ncbi:MAG TPA: SEC-C metal-binding domain-containing protein, partial [Actinomycetota bacterium]|nr:SEC-C metal-binding domain-containing protein [Actinomycetota bacterium]